MKYYFLTSLLLLSIHTSYSQILGGRDNGDISPQLAKPSSLSGGTFTGDVNNMTGQYSATIPLGSVATPGGLSFSLSLSHSGAFGFSNNQPTTSGIPYGDGWDLSLPTITFKMEEFHAFNFALENCNSTCGQNSINDMSSEYKNWDGELFWFSPTINIPGVASGNAIFKYVDTDINETAVFVLNTFDTPIEIRYDGSSWTATLPDGTVYDFGAAIKSYRAPSNKRIYPYDCASHIPNSSQAAYKMLKEEPTVSHAGIGLDKLIEPNLEFNTIYCSRIFNPNFFGQNILFTYETFGEVNYFKEFQQSHYRLVHRDVMEDRTLPYLPDYSTYTDILLTKIESFVVTGSPLDILELEYKTLREPGSAHFVSGAILDPNDPNAMRLDSLYTSKVVESYGANLNNSFNSWHKYRHSNYSGQDFFINPTNPYINSTGNYIVQSVGSNNDVSFDHSFLESPRLMQNSFLGVGDRYEIRTKITGNGPNDVLHGNGTVDIAIVTAKQPIPNVVNFASPNQTDYNSSKGTEIFSTFNMGMKWTRGATGALETSNFFTMPNVPADFKGFNIQIGPGNSDINYSYSDPLQLFNPSVSNLPNPLAAYPQLNASGLKSDGTVAHNFGIGLPWGMMAPVFNTMVRTDMNVQPSLESLYLGTWPAVSNPVDYAIHNPTKFDASVKLKEVQLIRYSKNAYMLQGVRQYKVNGEIGDIVQTGKKLIAQKKIEYDVEQVAAIKNKGYNQGAPLETENRLRFIFLLSKVVEIPVEGDLYAVDFGLSDPNNVLTTTLEYTDIIAEQTQGQNYFSYQQPYLGHHHFALTKYTDHLGGETTIEYYPIAQLPTRTVANFKDRPFCGVSLPANLSFQENKAFTMFTAVKSISKNVENYNSNTEEFYSPIRKWDYSYSEPINNRRDIALPSEFFRGQSMFDYDYAFGKVVVYSPKLEDGRRNHTEYIYYGKRNSDILTLVTPNEEEYVLYGKLKSVRNYDNESVLHDETIYNYSYTLAAIDGYGRPNFNKKGISLYDSQLFRDYEYEDFYKQDQITCENPNFLFNPNLPPFFFGDEAKLTLAPKTLKGPKYLPFYLYNELREDFTLTIDGSITYTDRINPDYLFNSYFVKKISEIHRVYENGLSKTQSLQPVFPPHVFVSGNPSGPIIVNPVIAHKEKDQPYIYKIHTIYDESISDLLSQDLLSDSVLIHLINEPNIKQANKTKVLLKQNNLSSSVWEALIQNFYQFAPSNLKALTNSQTYFNDDLKLYLISMCTPNAFPATQNPFSDVFFTGIMLKNNVLSDNVLSALATFDYPLPGNSFANVFQAQDRQLSGGLLTSVINSVNIKNSNALSTLSKQEFTDSIFIQLIKSNLSTDILISLIENVAFTPSDIIIEKILDDRSPDVTSMQRIIDQLDRDIDEGLKVKILSRYLLTGIIIQFRNSVNPLDTSCGNTVTTSRTFIETKKEFEYYEADYRGKAIGKPYELLFGLISSTNEPSSFPMSMPIWPGINSQSGITINKLQLKHEPSWQLFSVKTTSPHLPDAFNKEEYFYLYDLQNRYDRIWYNYELGNHDPLVMIDPGYPQYTDTLVYNNSFDDYYFSGGFPTIPEFDGMKFARAYKMRSTAFQKTAFSKNVNDVNPIKRSEYYDYDSRWSFSDYRILESTPVPVQGDPCPEVPTPNADCQECEYYSYIFDQTELQIILASYPDHWCAWENHPEITNKYKYDYWICPSQVNPSECGGYSEVVMCNDFTGPVLPENGAGYIITAKALEKTIQLRSVTIQVDTIDLSVAQEFDNGKFDAKNKYIADFQLGDPTQMDANGFKGVYKMLLPFTNLKVRTIDKRNDHYQPVLEHNQVDLKTKYYYDKTERKQYYNAQCAMQQYTTTTNTNIGLPVRITIGFGLPDSLSTAYQYTDAGMVKKVINPTGMFSEYSFDGFQRVIQTSQNGVRILADYQYNLWDHNSQLSFFDRTKQNFVASIIHNSATPNDNEKQRAYVDPLGRATNVITSYETAGGWMNHIYAGSVIYDNWDRATRAYKNYVIQENYLAFPEAGVPEANFNFGTNYSDSYYENNPKSRVTRASNYGVSIDDAANHVVRSQFFITNNIFMSCELGLSYEELIKTMKNGVTTNFRFYRTLTLDQDNKQQIDYSNAFGQKIATLKYNSQNEKIVTLFVYDSDGNLKEVINPKKQSSTMRYNLLGQLIIEKNVDHGERKYMYNKQGQVSLTLDQQGWKNLNTQGELDPFYRSYEYDIYGRLLKVGRTKGPINYNEHHLYGPLHYKTTFVGEIVDNIKYPLCPSGVLAESVYFEYLFTNSSTQDWLTDYKAFGCPASPSGFQNCIPNAILHINPASLLISNSQKTLEKTISYGNQFAPLQLGKVVETNSYNNEGNVAQRTNYLYDNFGQLNQQDVRFNPSPQAGSITFPIRSIIDYPNYNYRGALLEEKVDSDGDGIVDLHYFYEYDPLNRLRHVYAASAEVNSKTDATLLVSYEHDDANGLVLKKTHSIDNGSVTTEVVQTEYSYDVRDRLTAIQAKNAFLPNSNPLMDYHLYYDDNIAGQGFSQTTPFQYSTNWNGNINGSFMRYNFAQASNPPSSMGEPLVYGYQYDALNRLVNADAVVMDYVNEASSNQVNESYRIGDASYSYDVIGNLLTLQRGLRSPVVADILQLEEFSYNYSSNRLTGVTGINGTANRDYSYDLNGNILTDSYRKINSTEYGRAAYAYHLSLDDKEISYLYSSDDQRMYKEVSTITETKKEYYLSDGNGHVIGLRSEVTPTGQTTQIAWEYYAFGAEREARLTNLDSNPRFGPDEVSFYLNDHLGNTRVNYTPVATTIPPSDNEIFNDQFLQGQLLNWAGVSTTTVSVPSSSLVAQSPVGATQTVIHKPVSFEATNTYTISVLPYFDNMTSIALECSGNTFTLIDNGLPNTFTFQGTDNSDGITITGLGAGTFSIKSINLTEHHPGGEVISYRINNAIDYFPYGKVLREYVGGEKERFLTTQHERDAETGLDYRGARYYDCDVARFLSLDPLANQFPEWSAYNYVFCNPLRFIDPTGRSPENADGTEDPREDEHKKTGWTESHLQLMEAFGDPNGFSGMITNSVQQNNSTVQDKFSQLIKDATNKEYSETAIDKITSQFSGYDGMKKVSSNKFTLQAGWTMRNVYDSPSSGTMKLENTQITIAHKVNGKWTKGPVDVIKVTFSAPFGFLDKANDKIYLNGYIYGDKFYIKKEDGTYTNPLNLSK